MIRIIDNKKIDLTNHEWEIYLKICDSYKQYGGEQLFDNLFETDENGIIMYLIPPSKKQTSLEIFLFLVSVFNHQHVRLMYKQMDDFKKIIEEKFEKIDKK
ncbi:MAG: hypothetical protein LC122_12795 [Chitinophagales bacterium]|nr:hypothetical protein [Chitinophagales bacterium]